MSESHTAITDKILGTGLWHLQGENIVYSPAGFTGDKVDSHKFAFTDAPVTLPAHTVEQMHSIAGEMPSYYAMLANLGENLPDTGVSSQYKGLQLDAWSPPPVTMVDAMITADGEVKIAEVDVINPRGLGYLALEGMFHDTPHADAAIGAVKSAAAANGNTLTVLQGDLQGFYSPYYKLLQAALHEQGFACDITPETSIVVEDGQLLVDGKPWLPETLLDFPVLRKATRKSYGSLSAGITDAYNNGDLSILYPPQPHLSSKLLLAQASAQGIFGENLPKTVLCPDNAAARDHLAAGTYCVKAAVSSGMKGLWMPNTPYGITGKFPVVAQQLVDDQHVLELTHASGDSTDWKTGKFLARLSLFVGADGNLLAADVTGQPYSGEVVGVHGNPDCVLAPVALA